MSTSDKRVVHVFDNSVKVYHDHLLKLQLQRYANVNLHEPEEERIFLECLQRVLSDGVFLDIGAGVGYYSILARKTCRNLKIYAFEPFPVHQKRLRENLVLNALGRDRNIEIVPKAVTDYIGHARFTPHGYGSRVSGKVSGSIEMLRQRLRQIWPFKKAATDELFVSTTKIDALTRLSNIDLVKVDVQGDELQVLEGAQYMVEAGRIQQWIIGTHGKQRHDDCVKWLESHGYQIVVNDPDPVGQPDGIVVGRL